MVGVSRLKPDFGDRLPTIGHEQLHGADESRPLDEKLRPHAQLLEEASPHRSLTLARRYGQTAYRDAVEFLHDGIDSAFQSFGGTDRKRGPGTLQNIFTSGPMDDLKESRRVSTFRILMLDSMLHRLMQKGSDAHHGRDL